MEITVDTSKLHLPKGNEINIATQRALNHTFKKAVTAGNRAVTRKWNIKLKELKSYIHLKKATRNRLEAEIKVKSRSISLAHFGARQIKKGVSYKLRKDMGRKTLRHAFIATTKNGYVGVFTRKTKKRLPLNTFKSITPSSMYAKESIDAINEVMNRDFADRFRHELSRIER